jgi:hypothetical protein
MDNHGGDGNVDVLSLMKERGIELIWLPADSTHFLPALDAAVFGSFKSHDSNLRTKVTRPTLEGKLLHA